MEILLEINKLISRTKNLGSLIETIMLKILPSSPLLAADLTCKADHVEVVFDTHISWLCWAVTDGCGNDKCVDKVWRTYYYTDGTPPCRTIFWKCTWEGCSVPSTCG